MAPPLNTVPTPFKDVSNVKHSHPPINNANVRIPANRGGKSLRISYAAPDTYVFSISISSEPLKVA